MKEERGKRETMCERDTILTQSARVSLLSVGLELSSNMILKKDFIKQTEMDSREVLFHPGLVLFGVLLGSHDGCQETKTKRLDFNQG